MPNHGFTAPTGRVFVAGSGPCAGPCASFPLVSLWAAAGSIEAQALGLGQKEGLTRLTEAKIQHGRFTNEKRAEARRFAEK